MLLTGIAGVSAANVGHGTTKVNNTHIVSEKVNYQIIDLKDINKSDIKQNKSNKAVKYVKKTVKNKYQITPNKNTVKHKVHKKHLLHSKNLTKTSNTLYHNTNSSTTKKSIKITKTLKHSVTANTTKNSELYAAAGEPKKIKNTSSNTTGKFLAAGSPSTVKVPKSLRKYLKATKHCQVNNARIKSLSKQITRGKTTQKAKAVAIFNWVRNKVGYKFYYNTRKGAVGTLNARSGNCVDTAHLLIALERAAGIPARYIHAKAKFRSGHWYGHVWAGVYVNGKWYKADATSSRNSFGVTKNWSRAIIKGKYASLPF
ncbi:MAG TPA: transglutaminase-like domain-containing protein [Methanobacterium sp.]|nr:transglutaminase-like domain-containing protein [Methanobacterium sp.]